jgi:hypothetical protein
MCILDTCKNKKHENKEKYPTMMKEILKNVLKNPLNPEHNAELLKKINSINFYSQNDKDKKRFYTVCNYSSNRCDNCKEGRVKEISHNNSVIKICYPPIHMIKHKIIIGLHCDLNVFFNGSKIHEINISSEKEDATVYEEFTLSKFKGCSRCVLDKCNKPANHNTIEYPSILGNVLRNPLHVNFNRDLHEKIKSINFYEKDDVDKSKAEYYTVCNYTSERCDNCKQGRVKEIFHNGSSIQLCYPPDHLIKHKITIGIHCDLHILFNGQTVHKINILPEVINDHNEEYYTQSEQHRDTQSEQHRDTQSEQHRDTQSEQHRDTHSEQHRDTQSEQHRDTQSEQHRDTQSEQHRDTQSEQHRDTQSEQHRDTHSEQHRDTQMKQRSDSLLPQFFDFPSLHGSRVSSPSTIIPSSPVSNILDYSQFSKQKKIEEYKEKEDEKISEYQILLKKISELENTKSQYKKEIEKLTILNEDLKEKIRDIKEENHNNKIEEYLKEIEKLKRSISVNTRVMEQFFETSLDEYIVNDNY